ncbi:hypothetical protein JTB14_001565 [Gonioctena quinquepunctata]|nr:hypothetical protein JTB14_001565 [Gonioctena quinquepunctata]
MPKKEGIGSKCRDTEMCMTCREEGHRTDSMACPGYRTVVIREGKGLEPYKHNEGTISEPRKSKAAHDIANLTCKNKEVDLIMVVEPNEKIMVASE